MTRELFAVLAIVARAAIASAQPTVAEPVAPAPTPRVIVSFGTGLGGFNGTLSDIGYLLYVEGLVRPFARVPIFALVAYDHGTWSEDYEGSAGGEGQWWQLRAGAEYRECTRRGRTCAFLDGAVGVAQVTLDDRFPQYYLPRFPQTATTLSLRVGGDFGARNVRFRIALDFAEPVTHHFVSVNKTCLGTYDTLDLGTPSGLEVGLAAAF